MKLKQIKEFNLDAEITELNTPLRYSSTRLKYFYTEQDIKGLFEKCENHYLKLIEEKDSDIEGYKIMMNIKNELLEKFSKELQQTKELLKEIYENPNKTEKIRKFLNK